MIKMFLVRWLGIGLGTIIDGLVWTLSFTLLETKLQLLFAMYYSQLNFDKYPEQYIRRTK